MLKKYFYYIIVALLLAPLINWGYEYFLNPGMIFFNECIDVSKEWEKKVRKADEKCYIFVGGSEVRMGIEPLAMLEAHGIRAVNAGLQAGNGLRCNTQMGLNFLQSGDTLVMSVFPSSTDMGTGTSRSGINCCLMHHGCKCFFSNGGIIPFDFSLLSNLFYGSSSEISVYIMRLLTRPDCLFRYSSAKNARITESGRVEVFIRKDFPIRHRTRTNELPRVVFNGVDSLIRDVKAACQQRGVNVIAYLPRRGISSTYRPINAVMALYLVDLGIPVLRDQQLGTWESSSVCSDTREHLNVEAGYEFSALLAKLIKEEDYWTREELLRIIHDR